MGRLNLRPHDLSFIIESIDRMKRSLEDTAETLRRDTTQIQSKWDDDQFAQFKETMIMFHDSIGRMANQLENERNRVKQYQQDTSNSAERFNSDF